MKASAIVSQLLKTLLYIIALIFVPTNLAKLIKNYSNR